MYNVNPFSTINEFDIRSFIFFFIAGSVFLIVARVMFMLAVGEDAKARGVENKGLWMVLTFFFPICGLIYLGVRGNLKKTVPRLCPRCGETMPPNTQICLKCSNPNLLDYTVTNEKKFKKNATTYLVVGIVLAVCYFVCYGLGVYNVSKESIRYYQRQQNSKGYQDYFDDFDDYFDKYFEQFEGGNDNSSDDDGGDALDDFNNFGN